MKKILIIGGDSLVGSRLEEYLKVNNYYVKSTSRRKNCIDKIYLDFEKKLNIDFIKDFDVYVIAASVTNYDYCEYNEVSSYINTEKIPQLAINIIQQEKELIYLSTNSVFGGDQKWPHEKTSHDPKIQYAKQKSQAENKISIYVNENSKEKYYKVVRFTKIIDYQTKPFKEWIKDLSNNKEIHPFEDLIFSPITIDYVVQNLTKIINTNKSGEYHLSSEINIDYYEFAKKIATNMNININKVKRSNSKINNIKILFMPKYSGLSMKYTMEKTSIIPQKIEEVINFLTKK
jgi:dTDP-4-dehydrorhamnose reductase